MRAMGCQFLRGILQKALVSFALEPKMWSWFSNQIGVAFQWLNRGVGWGWDMRHPFGPTYFFSCSFWEINLQNNRLSQSSGVGAPSGKSWIRHCIQKKIVALKPRQASSLLKKLRVDFWSLTPCDVSDVLACEAADVQDKYLRIYLIWSVEKHESPLIRLMEQVNLTKLVHKDQQRNTSLGVKMVKLVSAATSSGGRSTSVGSVHT